MDREHSVQRNPRLRQAGVGCRHDLPLAHDGRDAAPVGRVVTRESGQQSAESREELIANGEREIPHLHGSLRCALLAVMNLPLAVRKIARRRIEALKIVVTIRE